nr:MAG TPA: hypothetical protein [Caudoviricetes sp.]
MAFYPLLWKFPSFEIISSVGHFQLRLAYITTLYYLA